MNEVQVRKFNTEYLKLGFTIAGTKTTVYYMLGDLGKSKQPKNSFEIWAK